MFCVNFLPKKAPMLCAIFLPKKAPMLCVKFSPKKPPPPMLSVVVSLAEIITNVDEVDLIIFNSNNNPIQKVIKIILMLFS